MAKYKNEKEVIELMKEGWRLEAKTNYRNKIMSYYLCRPYLERAGELPLTRKTRDALVEKNLITSNDILVRSAKGIFKT